MFVCKESKLCEKGIGLHIRSVHSLLSGGQDPLKKQQPSSDNEAIEHQWLRCFFFVEGIRQQNPALNLLPVIRPRRNSLQLS